MTNMPSVWFHGVQVSLKYDQYSWSSDSCELWTDGRKTRCHQYLG